MSVHLESTFGIGAAFIGMVFAAVIEGASFVQAFYYFTHQNDTWHTKLPVAGVILSDVVRQALITHGVYTYTITHWGNLQELQSLVWTSSVPVIFSGATAFIVQSFLTLRIWRMSKRNIYITGSCAILVVGAFASLIFCVARTFSIKTVTGLGDTKAETITVSVLEAGADLIIAAALCTLLNLSRTGFYKSDAIIKKLIMYSVNTGLITSLCSLASLISVLVASNTLIYILFFYCLGPLYTNTLLATLNGRNILRGQHSEPSSANRMTYSLSDFSNYGSAGAQGQTISIKVDTTTQEYPPDHAQKTSR